MEPGGAEGGVVDGLALLRRGDGDDGADEGARGVVFAAVAPGVDPVFKLGFVEVGDGKMWGGEGVSVGGMRRLASRLLEKALEVLERGRLACVFSSGACLAVGWLRAFLSRLKFPPKISG